MLFFCCCGNTLTRSNDNSLQSNRSMERKEEWKEGIIAQMIFPCLHRTTVSLIDLTYD